MEMLVLMAAILKKKIRVVVDGEDDKYVKDKVSDHIWRPLVGGSWDVDATVTRGCDVLLLNESELLRSRIDSPCQRSLPCFLP